MTHVEDFVAVLTAHKVDGGVCRCGWGVPARQWKRTATLSVRHIAAALAAQEGERGGAEVAAEWASNYDFRPHSDRASAEGVRARFGGFIYTRERTSFPDSVTAWRRADHIEAQP